MNKVIYLDYNATTPIDPQVADAMLPYIYSHFGNPSSSHVYGKEAKTAVEIAREKVAEMLACHPDEVFFTSGGTESNNLAIKGYLQANRHRGNHIITSAVEHPAVLEVCNELALSGFELSIVPVDKDGRVQIEDVRSCIREDTILISIMHANNEVGTVQSIREIANLAHSHNIVMHTDAAQSIGKIDVNVKVLDVDLLSVAGHKLYAPKGVGALYVRRSTLLLKQMQGANHERNLRPGTENVIGIVGLGEACGLIHKNIADYSIHYMEMRNMLEGRLIDAGIDLKLNGDPNNRLPNTSSISFKGLKANEMIDSMQGLAVSAGAACHAERVSISHVLSAMQVPELYAMGTIRFSTGRNTTGDDILFAIEDITRIIN